MAKEIERKYLVINNNWQNNIIRKSVYRQGYMSSNKNCSVRIRISENRATINIKSATLGITRDEYEYEIPLDDANEMLDKLCTKPLIEKTRHYVKENDSTWELDVFSGDNEGLIVAEIELDDADQLIKLPDWAGKEVSDDPKYYNVCLVNNPYKDWPEKQ